MEDLPVDVQGKIGNLTDSLSNIEKSIDATVEFANYENLSTDEKVKYDLYLSYSINSLYWTYCKLQAIDPNNVSFNVLFFIAHITSLCTRSAGPATKVFF